MIEIAAFLLYNKLYAENRMGIIQINIKNESE